MLGWDWVNLPKSDVFHTCQLEEGSVSLPRIFTCFWEKVVSNSHTQKIYCFVVLAFRKIHADKKKDRDLKTQSGNWG